MYVKKKLQLKDVQTMNEAIKQASDSLANSKLEAEKMIKVNKILQEELQQLLTTVQFISILKEKQEVKL